MAKERRKPSQVINAKKLRKAIQWERSENSSRKSEIPREHFCKDGHNKGMDLTEAEDIKKRWLEYTEDYTKKIFKAQIITMV